MLRPSARIVVGGYDPSLAPDAYEPSPEVDFIVRGEGEHTLCELLRALERSEARTHESPIPNPESRHLSAIGGLSYRDGTRVVRNPPRPVIPLATEQLRLPNRRARVLSGYTMLGRPVDVVETSRGCTFDCSFCSIIEMRGRNFHPYAIDRVIADIADARANGARSVFMALYNADLGIDTSRLLTMRLYLPLSKYPKPEPRIALFQRIEERLRGVTAIEVGALTTNPPMSGGFPRQLELNGRPAAAGERLPEVTMVSVSPGYFDTIGLQIVRGRGLTDLDGTPGHENAIVNLRFVAMHFGGEDPLGRQIRLVDASPQLPSPPVVATIVGVIPTMRQRNFQEPDPDPVVYLPYRADPQRFLALVVRTHSAAGTVTSVIREEMRAIEPDLPLFSIQTMDERLAQERWPFRVFGTMRRFLFSAIARAGSLTRSGPSG